MIKEVQTYGNKCIPIMQFEKEMQQEGLFPIVVRPWGQDSYCDARVWKKLDNKLPFTIFYKSVYQSEWQNTGLISKSELLNCFDEANPHQKLRNYLLKPGNILGYNPALIAFSYHKEGNFELAASFLEEAPFNLVHELTLAEIYAKGSEVSYSEPKKAIHHYANVIREQPQNYELLLKSAQLIVTKFVETEFSRAYGYCQRVLKGEATPTEKAHAHYLLSTLYGTNKIIRLDIEKAFHHLLQSIPYTFKRCHSSHFTKKLRFYFNNNFFYNGILNQKGWTDEQIALSNLLLTAAYRHKNDLTPKRCFNLCYNTSSEIKPYILNLDLFITDTIPYVSAMIALAKIRFGDKSHKDYKVFKTSDPEAYKFYQEVFKPSTRGICASPTCSRQPPKAAVARKIYRDGETSKRGCSLHI